MKLKVFDRKKYMEAMSLLAKRNAPSYIMFSKQAMQLLLYYELLRQNRVFESKRYKTVLKA